jgi:hypothetical protein
MSKCYNSTALNWYQTLSEWYNHISARKPRQLWFWWYPVHSDPSSDGSPTLIKATLRFGLHLELARYIRKIVAVAVAVAAAAAAAEKIKPNYLSKIIFSSGCYLNVVACSGA